MPSAGFLSTRWATGAARLKIAGLTLAGLSIAALAMLAVIDAVNAHPVHAVAALPARRPAPAPQAPPASAVAQRAEYVRTENARPGLPGAVIDAARGSRAGLAAYADRVSVLPGQPVGLYVSTARRGERVAVRALRVGWYAGQGFRLVWEGSLTAGPQQPAVATVTQPLRDAGGATNTGAVYAPWRANLVLSTSDWPEGQYLLRLDALGVARYVPLTVRSATASGRVLVVDDPLTWQAYNEWGGRSLYGDRAGNPARRSLAVSFDRPYDDGYGAGRYLNYDLPIDRAAESLGLPLAWATDYDLALDPALVTGATAIVFGGHAEYWTGPMWDAVVTAIAHGTNAAFFGANTAYWRVRLAGRAVAQAAQPDRRDGRPRLVFAPKDAALDPLARTDPAGAATLFRSAPGARPEERLTGERYECFPVRAPWVVADPGWWGYAGTGLRAGTSLPGVVGPEVDRTPPGPSTQGPRDVVAATRVTCAGRLTVQTAAYWSNAAGAGVFTAGTMDWPRELTAPGVGTTLTTITDNVLIAFAQPHAGRLHPARRPGAGVTGHVEAEVR